MEDIKVLFIDPPGPTKGFHNGLALLCAVLTEIKCENEVLDLNNLNIVNPTVGGVQAILPVDLEIVDEHIRKTKPSIVGLPVLSVISMNVVEIIKYIREHFPEIKIIVGGPHIVFEPEKFMLETQADIAVIGEGEYAIQEIIQYFRGGKKLEDIFGIVYRDGDKTVKTTPRERVEDLDALPFPNYDTFTSLKYNQGQIFDYPLTTSRGCPFSCIFCCTHVVMGKKWRARSPQNVIDELKHAKEKYNVKKVAILDDNFTLKNERAMEVCELFAKQKWNISLRSLSGIRADCMDVPLLTKMKEAGFTNISVGIESLDPEVFAAVKKGETLEEIKTAIKNAKKVGIHIDGFFVIGLPHSTFEKDMQTVRDYKKLGINAWWSLATQYPHTELWDYAHHQGRILNDYRHVAQGIPGKGENMVAFDTPEYPKEKRKEAFYKAVLSTMDFTRIGYELTGLDRYIETCRVCLKYDQKSIVLYHYILARGFVGRHILRRNLQQKNKITGTIPGVLSSIRRFF